MTELISNFDMVPVQKSWLDSIEESLNEIFPDFTFRIESRFYSTIYVVITEGPINLDTSNQYLIDQVIVLIEQVIKNSTIPAWYPGDKNKPAMFYFIVEFGSTDCEYKYNNQPINLKQRELDVQLHLTKLRLELM